MTGKARPTAIGAHLVELEHDGDVSGVETLLRSGVVAADEIIAVTGKIAGGAPVVPGRAHALIALRQLLAAHGTRTPEQILDIPIVLTAGGIGLLARHMMVYTRHAWDGPVGDEPRLSMGTAMTAPIPPEHIGHVPMVQTIAGGVAAAIADAGIQASDTRYVLVKAPALQAADIEAAAARGVEITPFPPLIAAQKVNGAASLGVAVAVDGVRMPEDDEIAVNLDLWSARASASGGREDPRGQVVLFGNSTDAGGHLRAGHAALTDLLDIDALHRALADAGLPTEGHILTEEQRRRIVAVYVKIGTPAEGRLRGRRQVTEDQNPEYYNQLKAAVAGMYAGALQDTVLYISNAAVHQGPAGGGTVAVIVDHTP